MDIGNLVLKVNEAGLIRIENSAVRSGETGSNQLVMEDIRLNYDCKTDDFDYQEQQYEVLNKDGKKIYAYDLKRTYRADAGYYGMGEKYGFVNMNGRCTENWNTDVLGVSPIHTSAQMQYHTNVPFYIQLTPDLVYGVFHDTSFRNYFDFGKYHEAITVRADGGQVDYYFIHGESIRDVVSAYTALTGRAELPRRDYLGYQQCRWSYMSSKEVLEIATTFREKGIPLDVMYLDIDYMQDYKVFTLDSKRFNDFRKMVRKLAEMNIKLTVIIDPGVKKEKGYKAYDTGMKKDCFIKDETGKVYIGQVWPGKSAFPDFLQEKVRRWWAKLHKDLLKDGVTGIWNDMNEIADMSTETKTVPEELIHLTDDGREVEQKEMHNLYGHYHARASYEAMRDFNPDMRPFALTRAASAGTQRYSALWTGDNTSIWEHLEMSMPMLMNLGLSGFAYVGSDIGGFVADGSKELLERWMQLGVFYPLCRNHSCMNSLMQEPWAFGEDTEQVVVESIHHRYSLISHLYQLFYRHSMRGEPIIRPLFYHYENDIKTYDINDQFMFGHNMIVAPIIRPRTKERMVYLPAGRWYGELDGRWYEGGRSYIVTAERNQIPVFVKGGSLVLRNTGKTYVDEHLEDQLELHVYSGEDFEETLYFDDGQSYGYGKGEYALVKVKVKDGQVDIEEMKSEYRIPEFKVVEHE